MGLWIRLLLDCHGQYALVEGRFDFVRVDVRTQFDRAGELTVPAFAIDSAVRLAGFLALDGQDAIAQGQIDVLFFQVRKLGDDFDVLVAILDFEGRPARGKAA